MDATTMFRIDGHIVSLRLVNPEDAPFVYLLRTDPALNRFISPVSGGVDDQRAWIEAYKEREARSEEFYFLIEEVGSRKPCGLVRLYELERTQLIWGSWILHQDRPRLAALESAILSFGFAFETLGRDLCVLNVRRGNQTAIRFYRRFGMKETGADKENYYFEYSASDYRASAPRLREVLKLEAG
ncbi:GNAT family N-acetyltransferase [Novosphingobium jiangmenense]|uniref:GNAT family N-acetyltransferase n=1 Tax=Novosphingobium jiangmenense TaxID=2791981 RepID=A0ABS0HLC3_9SPHN|nr:GNAT family N-acetyltransferase [Novosphingobium jiangmenense]MBF9153056.1 GNAT family N-acetyltransferase [Novosphingobium jiangmenense]